MRSTRARRVAAIIGEGVICTAARRIGRDPRAG
jgi:hypothetical protein